MSDGKRFFSVREAAEVKLAVLEVLELQPEVIKLYMPYCPEVYYDGKVPVYSFGEYFDNIFKAANALVNQERDGNYTPARMNYSYQTSDVFWKLCMKPCTCPYCIHCSEVVGYDIPISKCITCDYGRLFGKCDGFNSSWKLAAKLAKELDEEIKLAKIDRNAMEEELTMIELSVGYKYA
jgi:hypothetical protein